MSNLRENIQSIVDQYVELLPTESLSPQIGSEVKASKFLLAIAKLAEYRDHLLKAKIEKDSMSTIEFKNSILAAEGSDAKKREAIALADPTYLEASTNAKTIDSDLQYVKTMMEVFNNAHILYRGLTKGEL